MQRRRFCLMGLGQILFWSCIQCDGPQMGRCCSRRWNGPGPTAPWCSMYVYICYIFNISIYLYNANTSANKVSRGVHMCMRHMNGHDTEWLFSSCTFSDLPMIRLTAGLTELGLTWPLAHKTHCQSWRYLGRKGDFLVNVHATYSATWPNQSMNYIEQHEGPPRYNKSISVHFISFTSPH